MLIIWRIIREWLQQKGQLYGYTRHMTTKINQKNPKWN